MGHPKLLISGAISLGPFYRPRHEILKKRSCIASLPLSYSGCTPVPNLRTTIARIPAIPQKCQIRWKEVHRWATLGKKAHDALKTYRGVEQYYAKLWAVESFQEINKYIVALFFKKKLKLECHQEQSSVNKANDINQFSREQVRANTSVTWGVIL